jgi:hypothetical protein
MNLQTTQQLLKARDFLQAISQISFSYTTLNRQFPIQNLRQEESRELTQAYLELINKVKSLSTEFEHELENNY